MNPTGLPELSKASMASENLRKAKILETKFVRETGKNNKLHICSIISFQNRKQSKQPPGSFKKHGNC